MTRNKKFDKTLEDVKKLSGSKRERAETLCEKLMFMDAELEKLAADIEKNGWTEVYQNGPNQMGVKKSTAGDVYNTLIKNYTSALKQVDDMLSSIPGEVDELEAKYF